MTIVLVIIAFILIAYYYGQYSTEFNMLRGFWETCGEFNKEAGLQIFSFYIGDQKNGKYPAYLLMIDSAQNMLINEPVHFDLSNTHGLKTDGCRKMKMKFVNIETDILPNTIDVKFYPETCKLVLSDAKKIYAVFFKNPVLSEMERINSEPSSSTMFESIQGIFMKKDKECKKENKPKPDEIMDVE